MTKYLCTLIPKHIMSMPFKSIPIQILHLLFHGIRYPICNKPLIPQLTQHRNMHFRLPKGVNLPPNGGSISKFIIKEGKPHIVVHQHVLVGGKSLVTHDPASAHKYQLASVHKVSDALFLQLGLVRPPSVEKGEV